MSLVSTNYSQCAKYSNYQDFLSSAENSSTSSNRLIDPNLEGNRLHENTDGSIELKPKAFGYVIGEGISTCWNFLSTRVNAFATKLWPSFNILPMVAAEESSVRMIVIKEDGSSEMVEMDRQRFNELFLDSWATGAYDAGEFDEAFEYRKAAHEVKLQAYGATDEVVAMSFIELGNCCNMLGKYLDAMRYYNDAYAITKELFDKTHPTNIELQNSIESCSKFLRGPGSNTSQY